MTLAQQLKQEVLQQGREEGLEMGLEKGEHRKAFAIAKNLFNMGADKDFIKKATQLSDQDLLSLED